MPFATNSGLPDGVKKNLPDRAQSVWRRVFNDALKTYSDESKAASVAWSVVKKQFRKTPDGKWISRGEARQIQKAELSKAYWDADYINSLPDTCFAFIESGGVKDEAGMTKPRSLRHFPIKDADGKPDEAHVLVALESMKDSPFGALACGSIALAAESLGIGESMNQHGTFTESVNFTDSRIDRDKRVIRGVSLVGESSTHGYDFDDTWHRAATPMLESQKVFINHPAWLVRKDKPMPNDVRDKAGRVRNVHYEADRKRNVGDLHLDRGANGDMILDQAESDPGGSGISIIHDSSYVVANGRRRLVKPDAIHRVDYVADPATTGGMFESNIPEETEEGEMKIEEITLSMLRESRSDLVAEIVESGAAERDGKIKALESEVATVRVELAAEKEKTAQRDRSDNIAKLLGEAKFSPEAEKEIRPALEKCASVEDMSAIIGAVKKATESKTMKSQERQAGDPGQAAAADLEKVWNSK